MATAHFNDDATRLWKEEALRTLTKNRRLSREIAASMASLRGTMAPELGVPFHWPQSAYEPTLERMVRGLYWHHYRSVLGLGAACEVTMLNHLPKDFIQDSSDWVTTDVGGGVFTYRFARAEDRPLFSVWVLQFFQSHWALVKTEPQQLNCP